MTSKKELTYLQELHELYLKIAPERSDLLRLIEESELSEHVYNSNAIENSTLSLKETERILLELEIDRAISLREVFEAKNLARIHEYLKNKLHELPLNRDSLVLLHKMLLSNIDDEIAGRFRTSGEYVRVGPHLAPPPEFVPQLLEDLFIDYNANLTEHHLNKIAYFHLQFEHIHPFNGGNGRIGRILVNWQLQKLGLPNVIVRNKDKKEYYRGLREFDSGQNTRIFSRMLYLSLTEALHKRIAYLQHKKIIPLVDFARQQNKSTSSVLNAAKRQTIPAFRERGTWKIGVEYNRS